jgi:hypothetical protein
MHRLKSERGLPKPFTIGGRNIQDWSLPTSDGKAGLEDEAASFDASASGRSGSLVPASGGDVTRSRVQINSTFHKFPFCREIQLAILNMGIAAPTQIQDMVIPRIMSGKNLMVVGQTGSGKTLAYLLPILDALKKGDTENLYPLSGGRPCMLVLVPTRELARQLLQVVRAFPVQSTSCSAGLSFVKEVRDLRNGVDVVIATPARMLLHIYKGNMSFAHLKYLVIDEADTLCDTFYEQEVMNIMERIKGLAGVCKGDGEEEDEGPRFGSDEAWSARESERTRREKEMLEKTRAEDNEANEAADQGLMHAESFLALKRKRTTQLVMVGGWGVLRYIAGLYTVYSYMCISLFQVAATCTGAVTGFMRKVLSGDMSQVRCVNVFKCLYIDSAIE